MKSSFSSEIKILIGNPYVTPPQEILDSIFKKAGKDKGTIPIKGRLNGAPYTQTLVRYSGDWRLYINGMMAKAAGLKYSGSIVAIVGKKVDIEIEFDSKSRQLPMHPKLAKALSQDKKAQLVYEALAPYRKHEILRYLGFLKNPSTIDKNIKRILQHLRGEESDALYPLMHRKKTPSV